jgi:polyisoprenoid-binding protein YceI
MRIAQSVVLALVAVLAGAPAARAVEQVLQLDPAATTVRFDVEATGHDVHGTFHVTAGEVRFDPLTGAAAGEIRVDALSAVTGNRSRDKTLLGDVLEVERFPIFLFTPERLVGTLPESGEARLELRGVATVHGSAHAITLPARVHVAGGRVEIHAYFPIPYVEWGLHNPSLFFLRVADVVQVHVEGSGSLAVATAEAIASHGR